MKLCLAVLLFVCFVGMYNAQYTPRRVEDLPGYEECGLFICSRHTIICTRRRDTCRKFLCPNDVRNYNCHERAAGNYSSVYYNHHLSLQKNCRGLEWGVDSPCNFTRLATDDWTADDERGAPKFYNQTTYDLYNPYD